MRLKLLLFLLKVKLQLFAKFKPAMKKLLRKENFILAIRTEDLNVCRYYSFSYGKVSSSSGPIENADTIMVWESASIAFKVLTGSEAAVFEALGKAQLVIKGNLENFFKFGDIAKV